MNAGAEGQEAVREEARRLYWSSSKSVNSIAEDLGISKGTLYEWIDPFPAGLPCPACGDELAFPNRTARERGFVECTGCGLKEEASAVSDGLHERAARSAGGTPPSDPREREVGGSGTVILGVALLGAAAGVVLGSWMRRR